MRHHLIYSRLGRYSAGGGLAVTGYHDRSDAHGFKGCDSLSARLPYPVRDSYDPVEGAPGRDIHHGLALPR
ncbi:hypothetical protein SDC9_199411 [bioreactor metagenome]|uniref:Uncharacterized protein n=1 Tax=bioreactor metagenome TaxID=1076179 RepID=A0A645ILP6_9ZZZZ